MGLGAITLSACAIVDNVGLHTNTLNESIADYNAYSILLNIVRASESEPLNFVSVTQASPNTSLMGNAAVPTFTLSPSVLTSYTTPGNSAQATTSDALTVQPVDDPGSWQALLTPIDVGTIGFFVKQGYPAELLFWLFVDRIRICDDSACNHNIELVNDADDPSFHTKKGERSPAFAKLLPNLIADGLTVDIARGAAKSGETPESEICFGIAAARNARQLAQKNLQLTSGTRSPGPMPPLPPPNDCTGWLSGQKNSSDSTNSSKGSSSTVLSQPLYVYLNYLDPNKLPKSQQQKQQKPQAWYDLPSKDIPLATRGAAWPNRPFPKGGKIQFSTRSAYGVYLFLGRALERRDQLQLTYTGDDPYILHITRDQVSDCYTQIVYNSVQYCVPRTAYNTKRTFAILHQLVGLNIVHASTPAVLNVRTLP